MTLLSLCGWNLILYFSLKVDCSYCLVWWYSYSMEGYTALCYLLMSCRNWFHVVVVVGRFLIGFHLNSWLKAVIVVVGFLIEVVRWFQCYLMGFRWCLWSMLIFRILVCGIYFSRVQRVFQCFWIIPNNLILFLFENVYGKAFIVYGKLITCSDE